MFGLGWIKILVVVAVLSAIGGTIYAGYLHVQGLQAEITRLTTDNATLAANNIQLTQAIQTQQEAYETVLADFKRSQQIQQETFQQFQDARDQVDELEEKLGRHELGFLAASRPGLVQNIINSATDEVGRCFEIASGSPLTPDETAATRPSEINSQCPELANPNYRRRP